MSNIPKLRFSEFVGEWEEKKLGTVLSFKNGINADKEKYGKGYKFINVLDIINNLTIFYEKILGSVDVSKEVFENHKVEYGNILFQRSSETREESGQSNVYLDRKNFATFGGFVIRGQQKIDYNPEFMNYMFKTQHARKEITQKSNGSTRYNVGQDTLSKVVVYLPLKPEQEKIASFLSFVDNKIEQLTKKQHLIREYKKGVMQQIFNQKLRFKEFSGEWGKKKGNLVFKVTPNKTHNSDLPILAISQEFGAIPREMINYRISVSEKSVSSYKVVEIGDFIISLRSFQGGIEYSKYKGICSPAYIILRAFIEIDSDFFKYFFKSYKYIQQLNTKLEGIRDGKMISYKYFSEINLPFPTKPEQEKIASFLSSIDAKIKQTSEQLNQAKQFKKALLQQMFV